MVFIDLLSVRCQMHAAVILRELVTSPLGLLSAPERTADALVQPIVSPDIPDIPLVVDFRESWKVLSLPRLQAFAQFGYSLIISHAYIIS